MKHQYISAAIVYSCSRLCLPVYHSQGYKRPLSFFFIAMFAVIGGKTQLLINIHEDLLPLDTSAEYTVLCATQEFS